MSKIHYYNTQQFPFAHAIGSIVRQPLQTLHKADTASGKVVKRETDQGTAWHKLFYDNNAAFLNLYRRFIHEVITQHFGERLVYQTVPTFRVQYPNNKSVGEFHADGDYGHNPNEINIFLPFTDAYGTSTIWCESKEGKEDYQPINTRYGEFAVFDGVRLKHGNKINRTGKTRVSVDFRVIPYSKYQEEEGKTSINTKMKFAIGGYYSLGDQYLKPPF